MIVHKLCICHRPSPRGGGTAGKGGDFVQDPGEVLDFPLLEGDTEQSKLRNTPSQMGITSFPDEEVAFILQSVWKGKKKSLMLVNCLPLLYLKQQT